MKKSALQLRRERVLGAGAELFYRQPLHIVRGEGAYLYDADGRRYLDMYNNVPCVGHGNPAVVEAMAQQQATLNVHSRYLHEGIVSFAERLTGLQHDGIDSAIFSCSGTEAVDVGLQMARVATGQQGIICTNYTYHGNSILVDQLSYLGRTDQQTGYIRAIPYPQMYRPLIDGASEQEIGIAYLQTVRDAIGSLQRSDAGFSALIMCSIFANEGLPDIPRGFMKSAAEMARDAGGVVIADEVQAGYGRTGTWWGYDASDYIPDVIVSGKPMGNGLPLAATTASKALVDGFRTNKDHFNTCAASPLQAAVGLAVLDEIERGKLVENAGNVGAMLKSELDKRKAHYAFIGDVRGQGLFLVVEMIKDVATKAADAARASQITNRLKDKGFLTCTDGAYNNVVKIRPPLVFSDQDADEFLVAFDDVLSEIDE